MRYELFEEVLSIGSNDIREHDDVGCSIEADDDELIRVLFQFARSDAHEASI